MTVLVILFALVVAVLAVPFEVIFKFRRHPAVHSDIAIYWLFGIVRIPVSSEGTEKPVKKFRKTKKAKEAKQKSANFGTITNLLWNARFRYRLFKFVKDVFKSIHILSFYLRLRLGLDDPADTGRLWAFCGPLAVFLSSLSNATVHLEPDFHEEIVDLDSSGRIRIVPLQVIFTVLAFVFSPITIHALWMMRKSSNQ